MGKTIAVIAASLVALVALGYLFLTGIGKPVSTDLSVIGEGKPVLVLVYENYSPVSSDALGRLNKVMGDYDSRLEFVVADLGVPQGRAFAERHQLINGQAMLMNQDGGPVSATTIPADEQELRGLLDSKLAAVE